MLKIHFSFRNFSRKLNINFVKKKILNKQHAFSFKKQSCCYLIFSLRGSILSLFSLSWYPFLKSYFQQPIGERTDICVSEMSSYLIQGRQREREVRLPALHRLMVAGV